MISSWERLNASSCPLKEPSSFPSALPHLSLLSTPASLLLLILLTAYLARNFILRNNGNVHRLPGPSTAIASWIWGHELLTFQHEANQIYSMWMRACGPVFKIKAALFHPDIVVVADHAAVQHILADPMNYAKSSAFRPQLINIGGKGLVWAEGEEHQRMRKILAPAFSQDLIKDMASDIYECAENLERALIDHVLSNEGGVTVNIVHYSSSCTLDIIGRVAFGHDFKAITPSLLSSSLNTTLPASTKVLPISDADQIRFSWERLVDIAITPIAFVAPLIIRAFPAVTEIPLPLMRAQGVVKTVVRRLARRVIEQGCGTGIDVERVGKGKDVLSVLMRNRREDDKDEGEGLSDDQILDNIVTFILAGHETSAGVLNFILLELARHPLVQTRLREEILAGGHDLGYEGVQKLEFLDAVIKESLRLHPASPQTERVALMDDVIPLQIPISRKDVDMIRSLEVRKGQVFHIPFLAMNMNTAIWGPDAGIFNPARWLTAGIDSGGVPPPDELPHGWSGLLTFGDGPRNCIGWRLAVFELKVMVATLVRSFEFHDTGALVQQKIAVTLQPITDGKGGFLPLHITLA